MAWILVVCMLLRFYYGSLTFLSVISLSILFEAQQGYSLSYELEERLPLHKGRHELPAIHKTTLFVCALGYKKPLLISGHEVIYAIWRFLAKGSQDGDHCGSAVLLALRVRANGFIMQMLEVGKFGGNAGIRGSGSHACVFFGTCTW